MRRKFIKSSFIVRFKKNIYFSSSFLGRYLSSLLAYANQVLSIPFSTPHIYMNSCAPSIREFLESLFFLLPIGLPSVTCLTSSIRVRQFISTVIMYFLLLHYYYCIITIHSCNFYFNLILVSLFYILSVVKLYIGLHLKLYTVSSQFLIVISS